ncbi:MBL fold metallo-hydrolase [cf. Phormidesmis sp. LEGE 11477]|uniref:MBL fold metallo-hydrolase n=1 Tax=cf. Phormidesmis sp. LEGE 11477 TaxID=1828680 RepID=UPI00188053C0|nr:MBL fold metallo-hydrolase [cf. Phormidesmis sp. LEGE 11477]MBE9060793.1 MBL fold metallo-hydrolase [cf. Phormidesmis sp. LEGE 11477]
MANLKDRRDQNVAGDFYVDSSCIDCDTCRWVAPQIYSRVDSQSVVHHQPTTDSERIAALEALLACPTASIGTQDKPTDIRTVQQKFPLQIEGNIFYCGYHSQKSFGAASYFIQRPEGNVLVDSPRFTPPLVKQLEKLGGVKYMYLTHRDDVADHQKFHDRFGAQRILHIDDVSAGTKDVEIQPSGTEPFAIDDDLLVIPQPGHSAGHTVLLYKQKYLFTGDHLAWSARLGQLHAFRNFCWDSWTKQIESMKKLAEYTQGYAFEWVLPGHGRRFSAETEEMRDRMKTCIDWMESVA